jgi:hypothetical protein
MRAVVMLLPSRSSAADVVLYPLSRSQSQSESDSVSVSVSVCLLSRQHGGGFHQHHIISSWLNNTGSVADAKRAVMGI